MLLRASWATVEDALVAARRIVGSNGAVAAYRLDEKHVMVEGGHPTAVGLRGLDAVCTIMEAGAANQLADDVVRAVYGNWARPS
jgi:hypothetical protein